MFKDIKKKIIKFIVTLFFCILVSFINIYIISEKVTPSLKEMAEIKLNKYSNMIFNNAINQVLNDKINAMDFITINKDSDNSIVDFNPVAMNHMINLAATVIENNMMRLEEGDLESVGITNINLSDDEINNIKHGILAQIPAGMTTGITLLSNLGPMIPVRFHYIGHVNSNLVTNIKQYGINNALLEIGIDVEIQAQIIFPFSSEIKNLKCYIPIVIRMVNGEIPEYYYTRNIND